MSEFWFISFISTLSDLRHFALSLSLSADLSRCSVGRNPSTHRIYFIVAGISAVNLVSLIAGRLHRQGAEQIAIRNKDPRKCLGNS